MTDKQFKRLKRSEMIEIIYEYQKREMELQHQIERLEEKLQVQEMKISETGSIQDAIAVLNQVLLVSLQTADQYLKQVREICADQQQQAAEMLEQAKQKMESIVAAQEAVQQQADETDAQMSIESDVE
ncbi:MAG: hypothetical protein IKL87_08375 [Oscillospiraceae bacterium]|nr:hypothetical protein [Oscillospiraceae bacterium]